VLVRAALLVAGMVALGACGDPPPDCRQTGCPAGKACTLGVQPKQVGIATEGERVYYCAPAAPKLISEVPDDEQTIP